MNILILTSEFKPYVWGGLGRYTDEIYRRLKLIHNVDILNIPTYSKLFLDKEVSENEIIQETDNGNNIIHYFNSDIIDIFESVHNHKNISTLIENIYLHISVYFKKKYDLILLQDYYNSLLALKFLLMNKTKKIISVIHLPLYSGFTYFDKPLSDEIHHYLESIMIRYSEKVIVPSEFAKRVVIQSHSIDVNDIIVNYHGSHFFLKPDHKILNNKVLTILSVQRFTEQKGLMYLIKILKNLVKTKIDFHWIIIGNGPKADSFNARIALNNLTEYIEYIPFINHDKIEYYYNSADIFISTTAYETFGFTIIEAMSHGCLTLSFDNGSINELINNKISGFLFNTSEYLKIVDLIIQYNKNPKEFDEIKNNAIVKAKSFSWDKNIEKLSSLFNEVCYE